LRQNPKRCSFSIPLGIISKFVSRKGRQPAGAKIEGMNRLIAIEFQTGSDFPVEIVEEGPVRPSHTGLEWSHKAGHPHPEYLTPSRQAA
jgi:hypothetical protein